MQFLYSALSSNEFKALYTLLSPGPGTPVRTNTYSTPQRSIQPRYTLQGAMGDQCTKAFPVYCQVLIYGWVNRRTFGEQILPRDSKYRRLSVWRDSNPPSHGWESNALTTWPTVLPDQDILVVILNYIIHNHHSIWLLIHLDLRNCETEFATKITFWTTIMLSFMMNGSIMALRQNATWMTYFRTRTSPYIVTVGIALKVTSRSRLAQ